MALVKVLTCNQISQGPSPFANGPSARSLVLPSGTYPSQFEMPSSAVDNDSVGRQKSVPAVRDAIRRSTINQPYLSSYHPLEHLKRAGLSLSARNHSMHLSLFSMLHTVIDRGSHTRSELVFAMTTLAGDSICMHRSIRSANATSCPLGCGRGSWMADSCAWNLATPLSFLWTLHPYLCKVWFVMYTGTFFMALVSMWTTFW
jgi:hypothetical protein